MCPPDLVWHVYSNPISHVDLSQTGQHRETIPSVTWKQPCRRHNRAEHISRDLDLSVVVHCVERQDLLLWGWQASFPAPYVPSNYTTPGICCCNYVSNVCLEVKEILVCAYLKPWSTSGVHVYISVKNWFTSLVWGAAFAVFSALYA